MYIFIVDLKQYNSLEVGFPLPIGSWLLSTHLLGGNYVPPPKVCQVSCSCGFFVCFFDILWRHYGVRFAVSTSPRLLSVLKIILSCSTFNQKRSRDISFLAYPFALFSSPGKAFFVSYCVCMDTLLRRWLRPLCHFPKWTTFLPSPLRRIDATRCLSCVSSSFWKPVCGAWFTVPRNGTVFPWLFTVRSFPWLLGP